MLFRSCRARFGSVAGRACNGQRVMHGCRARRGSVAGAAAVRGAGLRGGVGGALRAPGLGLRRSLSAVRRRVGGWAVMAAWRCDRLSTKRGLGRGLRLRSVGLARVSRLRLAATLGQARRRAHQGVRSRFPALRSGPSRALRPGSLAPLRRVRWPPCDVERRRGRPRQSMPRRAMPGALARSSSASARSSSTFQW